MTTEHQEAWWIDCDPGVDDALAIMMAFAYKKNVVGLSCTFGNTLIDIATKNCAKILEICNVKCPIYRGSHQPLCDHHIPETDGYFGKDALGDVEEYKDMKGFTECIQEESAALALIRASKEAKAKGQQFVLIALGPLSTIAVAAAIDKTISERVDRFIIMGGTVHGRGFTQLSTEFNFDRDPDAAHRVIRDFNNIIIVPTETATTGRLTDEETVAFRSYPTKVGHFWRVISSVIVRDKDDNKAYLDAVYDAVAMTVALDENVVKKFAHVVATVDIKGRHTRGGLLAHWEDVNSTHDEFYKIDEKAPKKKIKIVMELHREKAISTQTQSLLKFD